MAHFLEMDEVLRLLAEARKHSVKAWLMCALAFVYQMRAHEIVGGSATWKNKKTGEKRRVHYPGLKPANIVGKSLLVKRLKGSNPVDAELLEHENPLLNIRKPLFDLCAQTPGNQRLFPVTARTFQRWIKQFGEAAGLPKQACHPHTMKSSSIDYLREKMPLEELQLVSGHKNLNSLRSYMNPRKSVAAKKAREAFKALAV
jgi:integrase